MEMQEPRMSLTFLKNKRWENVINASLSVLGANILIRLRYLFMQDITHECKVRLLMIYAATRPRKFESEKLRKLMDVRISFIILIS